MSPQAALRRCASRALRWGVLALALLGQLPMPVAHNHGAAGGLVSARLGRHIALLHAGNAPVPRGWHVHFLPPSALRFGGAGDATGTEPPDAPATGDFAPTTVAPAVDSPLVAAAPAILPDEPKPAAAAPGAPAVSRFLQTFSFEADLSGLIGVALC
jgi:hypothetical protein